MFATDWIPKSRHVLIRIGTENKNNSNDVKNCKVSKMIWQNIRRLTNS